MRGDDTARTERAGEADNIGSSDLVGETRDTVFGEKAGRAAKRGVAAPGDAVANLE